MKLKILTGMALATTILTALPALAMEVGETQTISTLSRTSLSNDQGAFESFWSYYEHAARKFDRKQEKIKKIVEEEMPRRKKVHEDSIQKLNESLDAIKGDQLQEIISKNILETINKCTVQFDSDNKSMENWLLNIGSFYKNLVENYDKEKTFEGLLEYLLDIRCTLIFNRHNFFRKSSNNGGEGGEFVFCAPAIKYKFPFNQACQEFNTERYQVLSMLIEEVLRKVVEELIKQEKNPNFLSLKIRNILGSSRSLHPYLKREEIYPGNPDEAIFKMINEGGVKWKNPYGDDRDTVNMCLFFNKETGKMDFNQEIEYVTSDGKKTKYSAEGKALLKRIKKNKQKKAKAKENKENLDFSEKNKGEKGEENTIEPQKIETKPGENTPAKDPKLPLEETKINFEKISPESGDDIKSLDEEEKTQYPKAPKTKKGKYHRIGKKGKDKQQENMTDTEEPEIKRPAIDEEKKEISYGTKSVQYTSTAWKAYENTKKDHPDLFAKHEKMMHAYFETLGTANLSKVKRLPIDDGIYFYSEKFKHDGGKIALHYPGHYGLRTYLKKNQEDGSYTVEAFAAHWHSKKKQYNKEVY